MEVSQVSNVFLNSSQTVTLYGDAVEFLPAAQFIKRNESWREGWRWGVGGVSIFFLGWWPQGDQAIWGQYIEVRGGGSQREDIPDFI